MSGREGDLSFLTSRGRRGADDATLGRGGGTRRGCEGTTNLAEVGGGGGRSAAAEDLWGRRCGLAKEGRREQISLVFFRERQLEALNDQLTLSIHSSSGT